MDRRLGPVHKRLEGTQETREALARAWRREGKSGALPSINVRYGSITDLATLPLQCPLLGVKQTFLIGVSNACSKRIADIRDRYRL